MDAMRVEGLSPCPWGVSEAQAEGHARPRMHRRTLHHMSMCVYIRIVSFTSFQTSVSWQFSNIESKESIRPPPVRPSAAMRSISVQSVLLQP